MENTLFSIAFYNVENLFDYNDSKKTLDKDFTPKGKKKWGKYRYDLKIKKIGKVISEIGTQKTPQPPSIIGLAEIENKTVLEDLVNSEYLQNLNYKYIHYDSPDERGIDVAFLYNTKDFCLIESKAIPVILYEKDATRNFTRDILFVKGILHGETVHIFVNHWPSKRNDYNEAVPNRIQLANLIHENITAIKDIDPKVIIMGDFNDNPNDVSIHKHLCKNNFTNPMLDLYKKGHGSSQFYGVWMLFDQIVLSNNFFSNTATTLFKEAAVYNESFLTNALGKFKGTPFRTYTGKYYLGGYSDHFPVYIILEKSIKKPQT